MRTAEEILNSKLTYGADTYDAGQRDNIIKAINEARIEAIKECVDLITKNAFYNGFDKCKNDDANCFTAWREIGPTLISNALKLIEQVK